MAEKNEVKVCFGMPLFNNSRYLPEALASILGQTYSDFAIVAVDDHSTDETDSLMQEFAARDNRISYHRNGKWEGLISTWRKAFLHAQQLYRPKYFAWISDHDRWDPRWLEKHMEFIQAHPEVAVVYPQTVPINEDGAVIENIDFAPFDTFDCKFSEHLFRVCTSQTGSGNAVYGLFRAKMLKKAGIFRHVLLPDRLLLTEISAFGKLKQLPDKLWYRRFFGGQKQKHIAVAQQRSYLFGPDPAPLHSYCPYISHILSLIINLSIFPANQKYRHSFRGLEMAGLLWERARNVVGSELEEVTAILDSNQSPDLSGKPGQMSTLFSVFDSLLPEGTNSQHPGCRIVDLLLQFAQANLEEEDAEDQGPAASRTRLFEF